MKGVKEFIFCFLFVNVIQCNMIQIYDSSTSKSPTYYIHARKLLELCFPNELNPMAISAELIDSMYEIQRNEAINSSILVIDKDFSSKVMNKYFTRHPSYLITADSLDKLQNTLREIKSSIIWNVASVIIALGKECGRASEILHAIWKIEALTSYYVCQHESTRKSVVYIFNPYTQQAPEQWEQVETEDQSDDRWTLYRQRLTNDKSICSSVTFDKTRSMDGYPLKGYKYGLKNQVFKGKVSPEAFFEEEATEHFIYDELFTALNVTPITYLKNVFDSDFERNFNLLKNGTYDIKLEIIDGMDDNGYRDLDIIPIYFQGSYMIITKKQSTISALTEVTNDSYAYKTLIMSAFFLFIIFVMILLNYQYHFDAALVDLLALVFSMGMLTPMNRLSMRITFLSATLFFFHFGPELQSQFTSVMTIPSMEKNFETLDELHDNRYIVNYFIYGAENINHTKIWENGTFNKYLKPISGLEYCTENLNENSAACIMPDYLLENMKIGDLYVSQESLFKSYHWLTTRKNFPLKSKIDKTAMNFVEAGFLNYLKRKNQLKRQLKKQKLIDMIEAREKCEFLDIPSFSSFLWFLAVIGLISLFAFAVELVCRVKKYRGKRLRKSKKIKRRVCRKIATLFRKIATVDCENNVTST